MAYRDLPGAVHLSRTGDGMKKIRLNVEELDVVSFDAGAIRFRGRTVQGYGDAVEIGIGDNGPVKTGDSLRYTCEPSLGNTACTQDATCSPTACGISCDPFCIPDTH
jgi:hypothetical protein